MIDRLEGKWETNEKDNRLQEKFWNTYLSYDRNNIHPNNEQPIHGKIHGKFGAKFLRDNAEWQQ